MFYTLISNGQTLQIAGSTAATGGVSQFYYDANQDVLYAVGTVTGADGKTIDLIMYWDGSSWTAVGNISNLITFSSWPSLSSITRSDDTLYALGALKQVTYMSELCYWDGTDWSGSGYGIGASSGSHLKIIDYNDALVLCGAGGGMPVDSPMTSYVSFGEIAFWNGNEFVDANYPGSYDVEDMIVYNNKVYAADYAWNGSSWSSWGYTISTSNTFILQFAVWNNKLVIGTSEKVFTWDGTNYDTIVHYVNHEVQDMAVFGNNLVICGNFDTIDGAEIKEVGIWNGTSWSGISGLGGNVNTVGGYYNQLLMASPEGYPIWDYTNLSNPIALGSIALYGTVSGIPENEANNFELYPNPNDGNTLNISLDGEYTLSIFNMIGQEIYRMDSHSGLQQLNLSKIQAGVYHVIIESDKLILTKKLIIR